MALATTAAVLAGGSAVAAYLDAKFHIRKDLALIRYQQLCEQGYRNAVKAKRISPWYELEETVDKYGSALCMWSRQRNYTFAEVHDLASKYAQWFLEQGVRPGDLVAIYLQNSPEYMMVWLGLICIGCAPAMINWNLEGKALLHCLQICQAKLLVVDEDAACRQRVEGSKKEIEQDMGTRIEVLDVLRKQEIAERDPKIPGDEYRKDVRADTPVCLVYTSGTTGLPKACAISTQRVRTITGPHLTPILGDKPGAGGDRWYICMPLYHGTGATSAMFAILSGISVAIAKKFSVTNFWKDVHDSESTIFVYVGETARYLLNAPPNPYERNHKVRCIWGNGMRPDIWEKFRTRFNIPEIGEFFNSTEGMLVLVNWDRGEYQAGCVGHDGLIMRYMKRNKFVPVLIDHDTGDIWRDPKTGFAKRMSYEHGGEILVALENEEGFRGYWGSPEASKQKLSKDVFKKGDVYYRTGDALRRSGDGKWYFVDRLGDTFRWKAENVSTAEVAEVLGQFPGVVEANVYGVPLPNHDGKAGCAALHLASDHKDSFNFNALLRHARSRLPRYAVPVFLRVVETSAHIHNFKQNKTPLRKEGVDPAQIGTQRSEGKADYFLWIPPRGDGYVAFDEDSWNKLVAGDARL